jgi:hypothetical protein
MSITLVCMERSTRTTITVDAQLLDEIKRQALETHRTVSQVIQDTMRESLAGIQQRSRPFKLTPVDTGGYQLGVDINNNAAVLEELERE